MLNLSTPVAPACSIALAALTPRIVRAERGFRQVPLSRGKHHTGRVSLGPNHPMVRVESHEEAQVAHVFAARHDFLALRSQPVTVWFHWNNRTHRYTPDFEVWLQCTADRPQCDGTAALRPSQGRQFLVEVKPEDWILRHARLWSARASALNTAFGLPLLVLSAAAAKEFP